MNQVPLENDVYVEASDEVRLVLLFAVMKLKPEDGERMLILNEFNRAQFPRSVKLSKIPKDVK